MASLNQNYLILRFNLQTSLRILLLKCVQPLTNLLSEVTICDQTFKFVEGVELLFISTNGKRLMLYEEAY